MYFTHSQSHNNENSDNYGDDDDDDNDDIYCDVFLTVGGDVCCTDWSWSRATVH